MSRRLRMAARAAPRAPVGGRAGGAAGAEARVGAAAVGSTENRAGGAAVVHSRAGSSAAATGVHETNQGASAAGSTSSPAGSEPGRVSSNLSAGPASAVHGANPLAGTGSAPGVDRNPSVGGQITAGEPQPGAAPANPEQGVTIFTGAENCQGQATCNAFPADSRLDIADARNVIAGPAGAVSFSLEPQWNANDTTNATLMNLGSGDSQQNRFQIFKDGQSLHLAFADNSGVQNDISTTIDGWQPGEQHLLTATWGPTQGGQGQVTFYIDGKSVGQQTYTGQLDVQQGTPLSIGSGYPDAPTVAGVFLDTHFYKRTLAPGEVAGQAAALLGQGGRQR